jgi:hypothetical protein
VAVVDYYKIVYPDYPVQIDRVGCEKDPPLHDPVMYVFNKLTPPKPLSPALIPLESFDSILELYICYSPTWYFSCDHDAEGLTAPRTA